MTGPLPALVRAADPLPALARAAEIPTPHLEYAALSPLLVVLGAALLGVLVEAFLPPARRLAAQVALSVVGILGALGAVVALAGRHQVLAEGAVAADGPALFLEGTLLVFGLAGVLLLAERRVEAGGSALVAQAAALPGSAAERRQPAEVVQTEAFPLALLALGGMLLFPASNDLLTMFVALEVLSLPLYLLCGLARRRRLLSQEAAVKYFLLGSFSSAFFLYGLALLYGYAGSVRLSDIASAVSGSGRSDALLVLGTALLAVGLLFKVSAAPFHSWTPDVYQGAPTPVTAFMAAGTKVAAFGALLRVFMVALPGASWDWRPMLWIVAIASMLVGAVLAVTQTDIKRMLAYSSIAHAGFILTGVVATSPAGIRGTLFYLLTYGFTTIGAFALVTLVRDAGGEASHLSRWAGVGRRSPVVGVTMTVFLLALAGIPLTSGFAGKFAVFSAAVGGGATPLVVVGVVTSAIAAFFYVRVIVLMFMSDPLPDGPTVAVPSPFTAATVALGLAVTVVLGVLPQPVLDLAQRASLFVR